METRQLSITYQAHSVEIPYIEIVGAQDGPSAFISAGMHGNEINGIAIVRRFLDALQDDGIRSQLSGRLILLPVMNPSGFSHMQRRVFEDDEDLNRSFGFEKAETFSQEIAKTLTECILRHCQFGVDLHDAGGRAVLVPHARIHAGEVRDYRSTRHMSRLFGTKLVLERPGKDHMLAIEMDRRFNVPVLTVEIGGAHRLYEEYYNTAITGLWNILAAFGMIERPLEIPERQFLLHDRMGVKVSEACQVHFHVCLGDQVHVGDKLGELYFPQRYTCETIYSPMCGYVFSLWGTNQAYAGATLYSILEEYDCHIARSTLEQFEMLPSLETHRIVM